ncbi:hypothetical protein FNU76_03340 [Chitinimonas arctica]|uniref:Uncharacterized protein n=1 Tax=Chitinimonas arctica TaxID=2594795 RepID=A0A516SBM3_9NEIS|nr:hypothetical protein [Chitinimonas arctica]QDQ25468.1 hypothetical protein FNU76_03340 [Chitinimonas arctica]
MADGIAFVPGPMAWVVDKLLERHHTEYSLLETHQAGGDCVTHVHETELAVLRKPGSPLLPGVKYGKGTAFFTRNAQLLGLLAKQTSTQEAQPVLAILFRDGDKTRSTAASDWQEKVDSMRRGFAQVECDTGVPMVPRPKSEAWLLCARRQPGYANCASLEDASGNDDSPNSLKKQLAALCGGLDPTADEQADWVVNGTVDPLRIHMPSFNAFKQALHAAAKNAGLPLLP